MDNCTVTRFGLNLSERSNCAPLNLRGGTLGYDTGQIPLSKTVTVRSSAFLVHTTRLKV